MPFCFQATPRSLDNCLRCAAQSLSRSCCISRIDMCSSWLIAVLNCSRTSGSVAARPRLTISSTCALLDALRRAMRLHDTLGEDASAAACLAWLGYGHLAQDRIEEALAFTDRAVERSRLMKYPSHTSANGMARYAFIRLPTWAATDSASPVRS